MGAVYDFKTKLDESGDADTPCGAFTNTKDLKRRSATLQVALERDPILSIRAFEFESLYGLDLIPDLRDVNTPFVSPLALANSFSEGSKVSMVLQKKTHKSKHH